jgi:hypothetical protein
MAFYEWSRRLISHSIMQFTLEVMKGIIDIKDLEIEANKLADEIYMAGLSFKYEKEKGKDLLVP